MRMGAAGDLPAAAPPLERRPRDGMSTVPRVSGAAPFASPLAGSGESSTGGLLGIDPKAEFVDTMEVDYADLPH